MPTLAPILRTIVVSCYTPVRYYVMLFTQHQLTSMRLCWTATFPWLSSHRIDVAKDFLQRNNHRHQLLPTSVLGVPPFWWVPVPVPLYKQKWRVPDSGSKNTFLTSLFLKNMSELMSGHKKCLFKWTTRLTFGKRTFMLAVLPSNTRLGQAGGRRRRPLGKFG